MYNILVVDDEPKIRESLHDYLTFKGAHVYLASNGEEAVRVCYEKNLDLVVMDVMMPVMNGIEACREIRKTSDVPVLFLSALGEEKNLIEGYEVGADDYIVKPFPLAVLYQKCQAIIMRYRRVDARKLITAGPITLDLSKEKVYADSSISEEVNPIEQNFQATEARSDTETILSEMKYQSGTAAPYGSEVILSDKDFQLLLYLVQNRGHVLNRELILTKIWGYDFDGDSRVVDTHIKRIRKALGDYGYLIHTKVNVGYYFEEGSS